MPARSNGKRVRDTMTAIPSAIVTSDPAVAPSLVPDIALCLSGGGYRAAIFHLGAVRWLNEIGWLPRLNRISSVSGGSILAGHLAYRFRNGWPAGPLTPEEWLEHIEEPFWQFVSHDIRTLPVLCRLVYWLPGLSSLLAPAEVLRREYVTHLLEGNDLELTALLKSPEFIFCATDMTFGVNWEASRKRVGDYMAGYVKPPPDWTLARAIAASSCFPPVFPPSRPRLPAENFRHGRYTKPDRLQKLAGIRLTDGGVYDNLGLQPAIRRKRVLVSDGGGLLEFTLVKNPFRRLIRYSELLQNGVGKLRKQWILRDFKARPRIKEGAYWGIGDRTARQPPFPDQEAVEQIAAIRTDMNAFTRAEFEILLNHGYLLAASNILQYAPQMLSRPIDPSSVKPPYPQWTDAARQERALRHSRKRLRPRWLR
jgi:NTE family protein